MNLKVLREFLGNLHIGPIPRDCEDVEITMRVVRTNDDGTIDVRVLVDGDERNEFVSTQVELKVLALAIGGFSVPNDMLEAARAAKHKREGVKS